MLRRGLFRVYINHDVIGCELGGVLKNVVAIASGIAQGLGVGDNTRAAVMTRGLAELTRLGVAMGGEPATFAGLTGMGDLMATCISPHSRNRYVGEQLGQGRPLDDIVAEMTMVAEGVKTAVTVQELAERHGVEMPVCDEIYRVVRARSAPRRPTAACARPATRPNPADSRSAATCPTVPFPRSAGDTVARRGHSPAEPPRLVITFSSAPHGLLMGPVRELVQRTRRTKGTDDGHPDPPTRDRDLGRRHPPDPPPRGEGVNPVAIHLNSMVITGREPVVVDTGAGVARDLWFEAVEAVVDPADVRWIFLSHDDPDHTGNLQEMLERAPQATLVTNWFTVERLSASFSLPMDRMRWVNEDESFHAGDRELRAIVPPAYDSPTTRGLLDTTTGVYWASDCFGTPVTHEVRDIAELDPGFFREAFLHFHRMVSPWHRWLDPVRYGRHLDMMRGLDASVAVGAHGPALRGRQIGSALNLLEELPHLPAATQPGHVDLEAMLERDRRRRTGRAHRRLNARPTTRGRRDTPPCPQHGGVSRRPLRLVNGQGADPRDQRRRDRLRRPPRPRPGHAATTARSSSPRPTVSTPAPVRRSARST